MSSKVCSNCDMIGLESEMDLIFGLCGYCRPYRPPPEVNRFEVIDHRTGGKGRVLLAWPSKVKVCMQDDGRTMKVFLNDA